MPQSSASGGSPRSSATWHNRDGGKLSAAGGGESEAEHWAVPQSSATRHNRVESLQDLFPLRGGLMGRSASGKAHWTVAFFLIFLCLLLLDNCSTHLSLPLFFITQKRARPYALLHWPGPFYIIFDHSSAHQHLRRVIPWLLPVLWPKSAIRHHKHGAGYSQSEI